MLHKSGSYKGLSHWTSQPEEKNSMEITLPMPVARGSIGLNPAVQGESHRLLGGLLLLN